MKPKGTKREIRKLNIGSGGAPKEGFVNIDRRNADMNIDVREGLPFETNSVDYIYCSHFIEHLSHDEAWRFLDESFRVLKRGGKIRLSTPDLKIFAAKYLARDISFWDSRRWPGKTSADQLNYVLREMGHLYIYDFESLHSLLRSVGFTRIQEVPFDASLDNRPDVSIFAEAEKFPADQNPNTPEYMDVMWAGRKFGVISEQPERIELYRHVASMCKGPNVLDLGCGDGALLSYLPDDLQKHGVDFSMVAIDRARERNVGHFEVGDIYKLNYGPDTFDTVIMMEVLEHIDDTDGAIAEAIRVMKDWARLIVTVPDEECITDEKWPGGVSLHVSNWSEDKARSLASMCGLNVTEVQKFGPNLIFALACSKSSVSVTNNTDRDIKVSFVMIVLNGMPFIEYSLKSIYDFAHEIIIVEGAVEKCMFAANPDGSSTDGTVEFIRSFPDPQNKIKLVQGRWPEKCEMQNEALKHVTGDYVWLINSDEVYKREHLEKIKRILIDDPSITQVNFIPDNFWKGLDHIFVSPRFFEPGCHYRRLFKYAPGAVFTSHRPPTMRWLGAEHTTEQMHLLDGQTTRKMGVVPYHYSYVLDEQVQQKIELYRRYGWGKDWKLDLLEWYRECFLKWTPENRHAIEQRYPVWTGDRNSRTQLFTGTHPEVMNGFKDKLRVNDRWPQQQTLQVVGDPYYQDKVIQAWSFIEIDKPVQERRKLMLDNIEHGRPFWNIHVALAFLADKLHPESYLEVGVRTGCSLLPVLHNSTVKEIVAVDVWEGDYAGMPNTKEYAAEQINTYKARTNRQCEIEYIKGDSHKRLKELIRSGRNFDLITIDGDHTESGAWEDLEDATRVLADTGAIVFDDIIHPSHLYLRKLVERFQQVHPDYAVLINTKQDNGCAIFLKGIDVPALLTKRHVGVPDGQGKRVRVAADYVRAGTHVETESSFGAEIRKLFAKIRPRKIVETGTYLGTGTTTIIARAMKALGIHDAVFYTIEVNPQNYARAKEYFAANKMNVQALNGLSVPRSMLPDRDQITRRTITDVDYDGIFVDHKEQRRVELYYGETDFPQVEDDLLRKCLERFDFRPDFVLLDSAGHIGSIEFDYLIKSLQGECYIALDDIYHVKHHRSFQRIQSDPRFEVITASKEKFGFCIAHFRPKADVRMQTVRHLLWVRTDSIGDAVLSSSMLPPLRKKYPAASITVVCQEHIAELYEACDAVDRIVTIPTEHRWKDQRHYDEFLDTIRALNPDLLINSVYSVHGLSDLKGLEFIPERIAIRQSPQATYTRLIPISSEIKSELQRHRAFLHGLGIVCESLEPSAWITQADIDYADAVLSEYGLDSKNTIVFFAGTRTNNRAYEGYLDALRPIVERLGCSVIALGWAAEHAINQVQLDALKTKKVNLCGQVTLRQSAAILSRCRIAFGAETGLAHIAAAVGVPHVILIGGGHFGRFMPYSPLTSLVCLPLNCYGCDWSCRYKQVRCIRGVKPYVITRALEDCMSGSSDKTRIYLQNSVPSEYDNRLLASEAIGAFANPDQVSLVYVDSQENRNIHIQGGSYDVSIVLATKNRAKLLDNMISSLKEAVEGISYEIIVIEGGSSDDTPDVLRKHNITQIYKEEECLGPGRHSWPQLYNFGFSKARGKWAMYASDDIAFSEHCISKALEILNKQNEDVAGGIFYYKNLCSTEPQWADFGINFTYGPKLLMNYGLLRSDYFRQFGGFDEAYRFYCADGDLCLKLYEKGKQLIPLPGCFVTHNNVLDVQKKENFRTSNLDIELYLKRWMHFVPTHQLPNPKRLMWEQNLLEQSNIDNLKSGSDNEKICPDASENLVQELQKRGLLHTNQPLRLHLGCGEQHLEGYVNIDYPQSEHTVMKPAADFFADIVDLAFSPGTVDEIRLHHVFEHFDRAVAMGLLCKWHQWLKKGGVICIETPDVEVSSNLLLGQDLSYRQIQGVIRHIFGSHEASWAIHKDGWYEAKFRHVLGSLGFKNINISRSVWQMTHNITVTAKKAENVDSQVLGVTAKKLLRDSMVDESASEEKVWAVWCKKIDELLGAACLGQSQNAGSQQAPGDSKNFTVLIFSKDRVMQLQAAIESFNLHCRDNDTANVVVLFKASNLVHKQQYDELKKKFPVVAFVEETDFRKQVLSLIERGKYVLFLVDDNMFVKPFLLKDVTVALDAEKRAIGFSLRLGKNTEYCYSLSSPQKLPEFECLKDGILKYNWPGAECDFGYPLEVSSSVYRVADILDLLKRLSYQNPNTLEAELAKNRNIFSSDKRSLLCFHHSVTFCNPVNKVQNVYAGNRVGADENYTVGKLAELYRQGVTIDVNRFSGFISNGAHQEVQLCFKNIAAGPVKISVITPCYNQARYLPQAVESIVNQTYRNWECIIVNDGSTDNTVEVANQLVEKYSDRQIRFMDKPHSGVSDTRNMGVEFAAGEWILPLDSDDMFEPSFMQRAADIIEREQNVDIVFANMQEFGASNGQWIPDEYSRAQVMATDTMPYASLYRKELWHKVGGYDKLLSILRQPEDWSFWISCSKHNVTVRRISEKLFLYRVHPQSTYLTKIKPNRRLAWAFVATCHPDLYPVQSLVEAWRLISECPDDVYERIAEAAQKCPEHGLAHFWRALANRKRGGTDDAMADCQTAGQKAKRNDWQSAFVLMRWQAGEGDVAAAAESLKKLLSIRPDFGWARNMLPVARHQRAETGDGNSTDKRKILFYFDRLGNPGETSPAGTVIAVFNLARVLKANWPDAVIHVTGDLVSHTEQCESFQILPFPSAEARQRFLDEYDIVFFATHIRWFRDVPKRPGQVWIIHQHCWDFDGESTARIEDVDAVICLSDMHRAFLETRGIDPEKFVVIPNLIDTNVYSPRNVPRDNHTIMFAGGIHPHKGVHVLMDAFQLLRRQMPDAELHLYGDGAMWRGGNQYGDYLKSAKPPGVYFHGYIDNKDMPEVYSRHGILCLPSVLETFPLVTVEAQACGCIPVVHKVGGVAATLIDGRTGLLYEPNTPEKLAETLFRGITMVEADPSMRQRAVDFARNNFSATNAAKYISGLEDRLAILKQRGVSSGLPRVHSGVRPWQTEQPQIPETKPLVSVIMPVYNGADYIGQAIESVLTQDYSSFEIIVIDDGSTDNTREIVQGYHDGRVRCLHQQNKGVSHARNFGIRNAKGQFIMPLDADDMMAPAFISKHLAEFEKHPEADLVYSDVLLIDEAGHPITAMKMPEYQDRRHMIRDLFRAGHPVVPFRLGIRRSVFDKIGFYDETLLVGEDYDMIRRFVKAALNAHHLGEPLHLRRMQPSSLTRTHSAPKAQSHFSVVKRFCETFTHEELFPDVPWHEMPADVRQLQAKCLVVVAYLGMGQDFVKSNAPNIYVKLAFEEACLQLNDCLKIDPGNWKIRQLLDKCERGRQKYDEGPRQAVSRVYQPQYC
jgi:glycosyltransferase involved in cell wall biosynthesis/ADP-heptose:LPS heptosyltransferase/predicted SAM-dependent methyltransferase/predicted O-methyltransferase YrrM